MTATMIDAVDSQPGGDSFCFIDAAQLRVGTELKVPIYDERDVLLLAKGKLISHSFLEKLSNRNVANVKVHESELSRVYACQPQGTAIEVPDDHRGHVCSLANTASVQLDELIRNGHQLGLPTQGEAFANELQDRGNEAYSDQTREAFIQSHHQSVDRMEDVLQTLLYGGRLDVDALSSVADEALTHLSDDSDLFACLGINPFSDKYPARHSMHTCMLAISMGTQLGLDSPTLKELAIGCLIHDAGMLQIDKRVYESSSVINSVAFLEITKHPVLVFDMMLEMAQIPRRSAFIAYQIHERCNGTGYPRKRVGDQIHFLSKVAAVADVFIGLVSPRPHRPGMLPYRAMERILEGTRAGLYDPTVVRALLQTVSLFPLGSYVELNDGRIGRIIRATGETYNNPVVEIWQPNQTQIDAQIVNLAEEDDLEVQRPLAQLDSGTDSADARAD